MLASAGIPGAFPYREIDGDMYVDGGVTGNIIYGGRISEEDSLPANWQRIHPGAPIPRIRYWVLFNNQLRTLPANVEARWPAIVTRALELSTRSATLTAMRHLHAMAEISRLKRNADVEVRIASIPGDWSAPVPGVFIKETMNNLADLGERMGADPSSWRTDPPPP
jgi:predicted acylesterase/phospholipase RssA